ncbi:MAG TPA: hypothetical protein VGL00_15405 [Terracidiphilus sp.]
MSKLHVHDSSAVHGTAMKGAKTARKATAPEITESKTMHVEVSVFLLFAAPASAPARWGNSQKSILRWFSSGPTVLPRGKRAEN